MKREPSVHVNHFRCLLDGFDVFYPEQPSRKIPERRERLRAVPSPALIVVFSVYSVTGIVAFILNPPVLARMPVQVRRAHFLPGRTGCLDGNFLAQFLAGQAAYFAADARHLGYVREFYLPCI